MNFHFLGIFCLLAACLLNCTESDSLLELEETEERSSDPVEDPPSSLPPVNSSGNSDEDEGFDPCPEVTYVLWEDENGRKITVVLEVFCDPMQNINTGCPPPALTEY